MKEIKCEGCNIPMCLIGGLAKAHQVGDFRKVEGSDYPIWVDTGIVEESLYQCPKCKDVVIK